MPVVPEGARASTLNLNSIHGGQTEDHAGLPSPCVPDRCRLVIDRRFLLEERLEEVKGEVHALLENLASERRGFRYAVRDVMEVHPVLTEPTMPVPRAVAEGVRRVLGREAQFICSPGTYDQKHIARIGHLHDCVAYGPGILDLAHQPDEFVLIDDLVASAKVMALAALDLLGVGGDPPGTPQRAGRRGRAAGRQCRGRGRTDRRHGRAGRPAGAGRRDVRGGAPGTVNTDALRLGGLISRVDGVVLSGGSVFGLEAVAGLIDWLAERGRGFSEWGPCLPIVTGAILFDLLNGGDKAWGGNSPYRALAGTAADRAARDVASGNVGAGLGAVAGGSKGGLGTASAFDAATGMTVAALVAVNSVGSVTMPGSRTMWAWHLEQAGELGGQSRRRTAPATPSRPSAASA